MKSFTLFLCFLICYCSPFAQSADSKDNSLLGLTPPGLTPEVFAPGTLCQEGRNEFGPSFSPDGHVLYFEIDDTLYQTEQTDNEWTPLHQVAGYENSAKKRIPKISKDGKFYTFGQKGDIYKGGYSKGTFMPAEKMPAPVNSEKFECDFSFTRNGTIYFCSQRTGTKGQCDVYRSRFVDGHYQEPENLEPFNTPGSECMVLIHPDEKWIIFTGFNRPDGFGSSDMYISFHLTGDKWTTPKNMGPDYNTSMGNGPISLSPDGKYFFFVKGIDSPAGAHNDIYWVDTRALDQFKMDKCCSP